MDATLITGASAGLGEIFAQKLAAQKHNLVLVARRKDKLEELATELRKTHGVEVVVMAGDLATQGAVPKLMAQLAKAKITITTLINNAGFGTLGPFADSDIAKQQEMIDLNISALVQLCHAVLPDMKVRGAGGILNVASTAAFLAGPKMATYYASKAFVLSFSEALHDEVKGLGIKVSCLCPGPTKTEFFKAADATHINLTKIAGSPEAVVDDGLAALARNQAYVISGWQNKILGHASRISPRFITRRIARILQ